MQNTDTAKSLKPEQEKAMIKKYSEEVASPKNTHLYSVILMSRMPATEEYPVLLARMSVDSNKQESDRACILVKFKDKGSEQCHLINIQKNAEKNEQIIERKQRLEQVQLLQIGKLIGKKSGAIPFPGKKNTVPLYYRGGKNSKFLSDDEFQKITDIINNEGQQFTKGHSQYKKHKTEYPFLTSLELNEDEEDKVMPSLLKLFMDEIKSDSDIRREIMVKGYTGILHVDAQMKQMTAAKTILYSSEYAKATASFFSKGKDTIYHSKLADEHKKNISQMESGELEGETSAKSIKTIIKKKM